MENGIVTVMFTLATVAVLFAVILGLGKKYHDENQKKNTLSKC